MVGAQFGGVLGEHDPFVRADGAQQAGEEGRLPEPMTETPLVMDTRRMISINPGSGPVEDATEQQSAENIQTFVMDLAKEHGLAVASIDRTPLADYGEGRFAFDLGFTDGRHAEVQMPGIPVDRIRAGGTRLYVDGSSWHWDFALRQCRPPDLGDGS
ncbi:hypothetical protein ABMX48_29290 [Streptomyces cavourensis]